MPAASTSSPAAALRAAFPEHAAEVLGARRAFVQDARGFVPASGGDAWSAAGGLDVILPASGSGVLRLRSGAFEVRVRERGAQGDGAIAGGAVAYAREGGRS